MTKWDNPYKEIQHLFRSEINGMLRRNNGITDRETVSKFFTTDDEEKIDKFLLRFFEINSSKDLEWKLKYSSIEVFRKDIQENKFVDVDSFLRLHNETRKTENRTEFPYIAPCNKKNQLVSHYDFSKTPVFGVDILVRPPVEFSSSKAECVSQRNLKVGSECFALVIHGDFQGKSLVNNSEYFHRLIVGDAFAIDNIVKLIPEIAHKCENDTKDALTSGNIEKATHNILNHLNSFSHAVSLSLVL